MGICTHFPRLCAPFCGLLYVRMRHYAPVFMRCFAPVCVSSRNLSNKARSRLYSICFRMVVHSSPLVETVVSVGCLCNRRRIRSSARRRLRHGIRHVLRPWMGLGFQLHPSIMGLMALWPIFAGIRVCWHASHMPDEPPQNKGASRHQ